MQNGKSQFARLLLLCFNILDGNYCNRQAYDFLRCSYWFFFMCTDRLYRKGSQKRKTDKCIQKKKQYFTILMIKIQHEVFSGKGAHKLLFLYQFTSYGTMAHILWVSDLTWLNAKFLSIENQMSCLESSESRNNFMLLATRITHM